VDDRLDSGGQTGQWRTDWTVEDRLDSVGQTGQWMTSSALELQMIKMMKSSVTCSHKKVNASGRRLVNYLPGYNNINTYSE